MADTTTVAEHATQQPLTVDEAMIAVMQEIGPVGKHGKNEKLNYQFQAMDDIVAAAQGPMAKYGLRMLPEVIDQKHFVRGERTNVAILTVRYRIRGPLGDEIDSPIVVVGEGADTSDKASNKAMTAAKKYAFKQAFEISDGADDGDFKHPVAAGSPVDWYIAQLDRRDVWQNPNALANLLERATGAGHDGLHMPNRPGVTLRSVIEARGKKLLAEQQERQHRQAEETEAVRAQMSAEYPEPSEPYDAWSQAEPARQAPQRPAAPPPPLAVPAPTPQWGTQPSPAPTPPPAPVQPDADAIQREFAAALADPVNGWRALHDLRARWGALLAQVLIHTDQWGTVDASSAVNIAIASWATLMQPHYAATTPAAAPPPPTPTTQPSAPSAAPAPAEEAPTAPTLRLAPRKADMSAAERARANTVAEVELQAQMLGVSTLEFVADLLPEGGTSVEDIKGGSRLQDHVKEHRPEVVAAFVGMGMNEAAAEYAKFGDRVPARDINKFLQNMLKVS